MVHSLQTYGAKPEQLKADIGTAVALADLEAALKGKKYKIVTFTHVDTSTGEVIIPPVHWPRLDLF